MVYSGFFHTRGSFILKDNEPRLMDMECIRVALYVETEYCPHLATPQNDSKTFFVYKLLPTNSLVQVISR